MDDDPPTSCSASFSSSKQHRLPRSLAFRVASPGADLRAAASLRALAFSTNLPETASGFAREAYIRSRSRQSWDALELRAMGFDKDYEECECLCLLGTIEDPVGLDEDDEDRDGDDELKEEEMELARSVMAEGDASCTLAPSAAEGEEEEERHGRGGASARRDRRLRRRRRRSSPWPLWT